jgi:TolB-like protein/tetratricopeptide (TPR) repeat protein
LSLFEELKRRNVFRVAVGYIVSCWLLVQVADIVLENIAAPGWVMQTIMLVMALGFPVVVFFSWAYEVTPEGIKRESEIDRSQSITHVTGRKLGRAITAVLVIALAFLAIDKFVLSAGREKAAIESAVQEATSQVLSEKVATEETLAEPDKSIAVLPFINMSDDASNEFFSEGLSEELLNLLAKIPELRVTSRSSAFSFKGKDFLIADIGRQLNVSNVLEGSVRKAGNQVRITAQLIKVDGDVHLWSETYDRSLDNIFAIQDEIATAVVTQLKLKLFGDMPTTHATDPKAYTLFLQARQLSNLLTPEGWQQSNVLYQQAISIDPDYAVAWAGLGRNYINLTGYNLLSPEEGYPKALEAANRALAIDPENAMAYSVLGWTAMMNDGELAVAAKYLERAMELEPTNISIIGHTADLVMRLGRLDEAITLAEYVAARDPVNPVNHLNLSGYYILAERLDEAIASSRIANSLSPGIGGAQYRLGEALLRKSEPEAALAAFEQEEDEEWRVKGTALALHDLEQFTEYEEAFSELRKRWGERWPVEIAHVYAWVGETDEVFAWLEKEYEANGLGGVMVDNFFKNLHDDPRWLPLLEKAGVSVDQLKAIEFDVTMPK